MPAARAAEETKDPDEEFLQDSKVPTDGLGLLNYLKVRSAHDGDLLQLDRLIRQLGAEDFRLRQEAAQKLIKLGPPAHAALRQAQKDKDKERARRAKECADQINRAWNFGLNLTVVRRLVKLHPEGTAQALLQFLPYAADEECEEEIWFGLDTLAVGQAFQPDTNHRQAGKPDLHGAPVLGTFAEFLKDKFPIRRAAAGYLFTRRGNADQRAAGKKLLADPEPIVRLRTAQGLLGAKDKDAIPVLIDLLDKLRWTEEAWQAEEMLHWVAGDDASEPTIGAGSTEARQKCRKAWEDWWQANAGKLDLAKLDQGYPDPRLILLLTSSSIRRNPHFVSLIGCDGRPRWQLDLFASHVQLLTKDRILVVEWQDLEIPRGTRRAVLSGGGINERDFNGNVLWRAPSKYVPHLAYRLPNQETLMLDRYNVTRISPEATELSSRRVQITEGKFKDFPLQCLQRLSNGRILCAFEDRQGLELWRCDLPNGPVTKTALVEGKYPRNPYTIKELPAGGYLITTPSDRHVEQVDTNGKRVWQASHLIPLDAAPLRDGNMLILSAVVLGSRLIEVTHDARTLSECFIKGSGTRFSPVLGLVALGFDQARSADFNLESSIPHRLKGLKSKDPFVRFASTYLLGELGPQALPAAKELIGALDDADETVRSWAESALAKIGIAIIPQLIAAAEDQRPTVRASVAWIFGEFRSEAKKTVPVLITLLRDKATAVRRRAAWSLGRLRADTKPAVLALVEALKDPDKVPDTKETSVSQAAAISLGNLGPAAKDAIPALTKTVKADDLVLRGLAIGALGQIGKEAESAVPDLLEALKVKDVPDKKKALTIRRATIWALGLIGPGAKNAVPALKEALKDPEAEIRTEAETSLKKIEQ
jgi:HEAT repeat protein